MAKILIIVGLCSVWLGVIHVGSEAQFSEFLGGAIIFALGVAIVAVNSGWTSKLDREVPGPRFWLVACAIAGALWMLVSACGMHQIDGYDMGTIVDTGWRWSQGQVPGNDFPCAYPAFFIIGSKLAVAMWGSKWLAYVRITAWFSVLTFLWSSALLSSILGRRWSVFLWAFTLQAMTSVVFSYWAYNTMTATLDVLLALSAMALIGRMSSWPLTISYYTSMVLAAGAKPNTAWLLIAITTTAMIQKTEKLRLAFGLLSAFMVFDMLLGISGLNIPLMVRSYTSVGGRVLDIHRWIGMFSYNSPWENACMITGTAVMAMLTMAALICIPSIIPAGTMLAGWIGFGTNSNQWQDLTIVLFGVFLTVIETQEMATSDDVRLFASINSVNAIYNHHKRWLLGGIATSVAIVFSICGTAQALCRHDVKDGGFQSFFEYDGNATTIRGGLFDGVHCGRIFSTVLSEEQGVLQKVGNDSVWFGPRLEWSYPQWGIVSPIGQPLFWEPGTSFAKKDADKYFRGFMNRKWKTLILFKGSAFDGYTQAQASEILDHYNVDQSSQTLLVLTRKNL